MNDPIFSVIVPLYNKERYITRAIDSILGQSIEDFELIVVDDGSTDKGVKIVNQYTDSRIILIEQENAGPGAARNKGIENARGKYIAFLDADDIWLDDYLKTISDLIKKHPNAGAYSTSFKIKKENGTFAKHIIKPLSSNIEWEGIIPNYFQHLLMKNSPFWTGTICVKKEVFARIGDFQIELKRGQDIDMWIRIFLNYDIAFSTKEKAIYYLEASSMKGKDEKLNQTEHYLTNHWQKMLDSGTIKECFCDDFQKLINIKYINISRFYLKYKNKKAAAEVLNNKLIHCKAEKYFLMLFTTVLPITTYVSFLNIKQQIKKKINK